MKNRYLGNFEKKCAQNLDIRREAAGNLGDIGRLYEYEVQHFETSNARIIV
jgi:hypothetical protein